MNNPLKKYSDLNEVIRTGRLTINIVHCNETLECILNVYHLLCLLS